jgi:hypothetical protein
LSAGSQSWGRDHSSKKVETCIRNPQTTRHLMQFVCGKCGSYCHIIAMINRSRTASRQYRESGRSKDRSFIGRGDPAAQNAMQLALRVPRLDQLAFLDQPVLMQLFVKRHSADP